MEMRKLSEREAHMLASRLEKEKGERAVFFINNLKAYSSDSVITIRSSGRLHAVCFPASAVLLAEDGWTPSEDEAVFIRTLDADAMIAPENTMTAIIPLIRCSTAEERHMMTITPDDFFSSQRRENCREVPKILRTHDDFLSLFRLYRRIPEMGDSFHEEDDEHNASSFSSRPSPFSAAAVFMGNEAVSGAYISNYDHPNAMISAVATLPEWRGKGFAASVVSALMDISFRENDMKRLSLWYTGDEAGRIYRSLGFRDIGKWIYIRRRK